MLRPASVALVAALLVGCGGTPAPPPPTKVEETKHAAAPQRMARDPHNPFRLAERDPPPPRSQPQIPAAEIDAALAAAAAARAAGDDFEVMRVLLPCANKVPKHTRCEGELAMVLAKYPARKAEADYYLKHAAADDDPGADADFYGRLAETLRQAPMWPEAVVAMQRRIERLSEPSAADYVALAELLQGVPNRELEAADALRRAFELEPAQLDYLRDAGLLLAQFPDKSAEALPILERYRDAIQTTEPDKLPQVEQRIAQLRAGLADSPPSAPAQAERDKPSTSP
jgi:tetratricopeptide (TPR) repeat protein